MNKAEIIAIIALIFSVLLLIKVFRLQARLNELSSDVARLEGRSEAYPLSKQDAAATIYVDDRALAPDLEQRLRYLLADGKKIQAIKELREAKDLKLKEAKDYVDAMERR
ncbi:hypothetical protein GCM10010912_04600 [Paenibacillus albidus]|uniref:Large ribosomal subunit protein bL12 C-terminal domain-containing protein n=1 Tax=Paenibacillus albidus TaxID=2041023 RepID=A0A917BZ30_9BACL|nr:ribosomal protein L7/L12 [Paenibacillus albidus]GGF62536.1 hypothetical protein GCM10010912_04600 [Paenibacillus albidus]